MSGSSVVNESFKQILNHAKTSGLAEVLCLCLAKSGSSLMSGSSNLLRAACEACRAIFSLLNAFEFLYCVDNTPIFPLCSLRSHSLLRLDISGFDQGLLLGTDLATIVDGLTKSFLKSKSIQIAIYYCLHQRFEATLNAAVQVPNFCYISVRIHLLMLFCKWRPMKTLNL